MDCTVAIPVVEHECNTENAFFVYIFLLCNIHINRIYQVNTRILLDTKQTK